MSDKKDLIDLDYLQDPVVVTPKRKKGNTREFNAIVGELTNHLATINNTDLDNISYENLGANDFFAPVTTAAAGAAEEGMNEATQQQLINLIVGDEVFDIAGGPSGVSKKDINLPKLLTEMGKRYIESEKEFVNSHVELGMHMFDSIVKGAGTVTDAYAKVGLKLLEAAPGVAKKIGQGILVGIDALNPTPIEDILSNGWIRESLTLPDDKTRQLENAQNSAVIQQHLDSAVNIGFDKDALVLSQYNGLKGIKKKALEVATFTAASEAFEEMMATNVYVQGLDFPAFLKLWNPSMDWDKQLMEGSVDGDSLAYLYQEMFHQDMGVMKLAILEGYQEYIQQQMKNAQGNGIRE